MKNFPHQFNDLHKLFGALQAASGLVAQGEALTDEVFGEALTQKGIYTFREKGISISQYLENEKQKEPSNRGFQTVARDIRRLFDMLGLITFSPDKTARLSMLGKILLQSTAGETRNLIWREAFYALALEGADGEISHPYRLLMRLLRWRPGIETSKLMLALEAENDSEEEFGRIIALAGLDFDAILGETGATPSMAKNAVKILPGVAEQLGDIRRERNRSFPAAQLVATEDEIDTDLTIGERAKGLKRSEFRATSAADMAKAPDNKDIFSIPIDLADAVKIRQRRYALHQEIVRLLGALHEKAGFQLYEGKFDCLAVKESAVLLYEVKTLFGNGTDEEKQSVRGVGQLKFYQFSIVIQQMGFLKARQFLVFSRRPGQSILGFCSFEGIGVVWVESHSFWTVDPVTGDKAVFDPASIT